MNSALIFALREYLDEVAEINPHFYFIDSPLHGLDLDNDITAEEDIRKGFFDYITENYGEDQIIIIENTKNHELPSINENDENVKVIRFGRNGRNGFLKDVVRK